MLWAWFSKQEGEEPILKHSLGYVQIGCCTILCFSCAAVRDSTPLENMLHWRLK